MNIFNTFDQLGDDYLAIKIIKLGLSALLGNTIDEKLELCYMSLDSFSLINADTICDLLVTLESTLDIRENHFKSQIDLFYVTMNSNNGNQINSKDFANLVKVHQACTTIMHLLSQLESKEHVKLEQLHISSLVTEENYSELQSTLNNLIEIPKSSGSENENHNMERDVAEETPKIIDYGLNIENLMEKFLIDSLEDTKELLEIDDLIMDEYQQNNFQDIKLTTDEIIYPDFNVPANLSSRIDFYDSSLEISKSKTQTIEISSNLTTSRLSRTNCSRLCSPNCVVI